MGTEKTEENAEKQEEAKKEEIRIDWIFGGTYEVLKQREKGRWNKPGERKTLGEVRDLFRSGRYAVTLEETTFYEILSYEKNQKGKTEESLSGKRLESKTI